MTDDYLENSFKSALACAKEAGKISAATYLHLSMLPHETMEQAMAAAQELLHFVTHHAYYDLLERIEKGESMESAETDPVKKRHYQELLKIRYAELDQLNAKDGAA